MSNKTGIQSILIPISFGRKEADSWIKKNGYIVKFGTKKGPDVTENFYRYRQKRPSKRYKYRTRKLENGIEFIYYIKI